MDYTKYVLKDNEELASILEGKDNIFVIACNKCFKEFESVNETDGDEFVKFATEQGKKITGIINMDFLCNQLITAKKLEGVIPEGTDYIAVVSCGLGIQIIADLEDLPVIAASNSLNYIGHHGMALTQKTCGACAQCYLNITGGICPIVDCSKSLLNGQCGGAKNGKCEVDPKKDCAWEKIYQRLEAQGRQKDFLDQPVQLRDYSKVNFKVVNDYVKAIRDGRLTGYNGGVHPSENKELAENIPLAKFPEPDVVVIPTSMHAGAPATPVVQVGDTVKMGQLIAEAAGFISANVHSSVSGKVIAIEPRPHSKGTDVLSIVIENDKQGTLCGRVQPAKPLEELTPEEIVAIVKDKGITGMGGAGFPTSVKLAPGKPIDAVLLNGCECEPYLTADHRVLLEYADDVIFGLKAIMKAVAAPKGIIVIEDNKPDAIELMEAKTADMDDIEVSTVRTKYPQGAEKMLIKNVMKRMVPSGGLPADVGAVVANVSTAVAISDAIQKGMPLIERAVSVTGDYIKNPGNFMVKIGTNVQDIIDYCGGITREGATVKMGGLMMGAVLENTNVPVIKGTNGIIAVNTAYTEANECIKCGRCMDVCPMELAPLKFYKYMKENNAKALLDNNIRDCFECGCCQYICSSKIPLVMWIKSGKQAITEVK
ncbi:MAG: electron transport complex subunit RsxC [Lachnospiraceae bacterium]|nr:electron transport complex subunit RsxC [Lachnospiraceae bacterium]MBR3361951.1 electron transport complex subunit RsxC [Lachnospiraceae bacterium]MBR7076270.1 electron transport complex subunit RsxC [Lachnospiraceae bacterium]